jgi:hypothetical protein
MQGTIDMHFTIQNKAQSHHRTTILDQTCHEFLEYVTNVLGGSSKGYLYD